MSEKLLQETELEEAALRQAQHLLENASLTTVENLMLASRITRAAIEAVTQLLFRKALTADSIEELLEAFTLPPLQVADKEMKLP